MTLIVFKPTGEVRRAGRMEWYYRFGDFIQNTFLTETHYPYPILTRHEIEATPDVLRALGMEETRPCPYPLPEDDGTAKDCISKGHCGCILSDDKEAK